MNDTVKVRMLWQMFSMQRGPVKKTKEMILQCYKWHTTAAETKNLKSILHYPHQDVD
jgi:hypothetical protein